MGQTTTRHEKTLEPFLNHDHAKASDPLWPLLALFLGAAAIATSPIWVRLSELNPTTSAFQRVFLALPLLAAYLRFKGLSISGQWRSLSPATRNGALLAGLFFAGDLASWHWSIEYTTVANSTLFANFSPIFVTLITWLVYKQHVSKGFLLGMFAALSGAMVLVGFNLVMAPERLIGDGLGMITGMFYAGYILSIARARRVMDVASVLFFSTAATAVCLLPLALLAPGPLFPATLNGWLIILALAWFSHSVGQGLIAFALAHLPATFSSVGLLTQPLIAALLAWWLFAEAIGPWQALGGAVIVLGIVIAKRGS
ncbi:MAG: DMT family transporter [Gammaproteobacteria bacterium]